MEKYPEADQWIALDQLLGLTVYSSKDDARKSAAAAAKQSKE
jgi:hypothetical protein